MLLNNILTKFCENQGLSVASYPNVIISFGLLLVSLQFSFYLMDIVCIVT